MVASMWQPILPTLDILRDSLAKCAHMYHQNAELTTDNFCATRSSCPVISVFDRSLSKKSLYSLVQRVQ